MADETTDDDVRAAARMVASVLDSDCRCSRCEREGVGEGWRWVWLPNRPIWCCPTCADEGEKWLERTKRTQRAERAAAILRGVA